MLRALVLACLAITALTIRADLASAEPFYARLEAGTVSPSVDAYGTTLDLPEGSTYGAYLGTAVGPVRVEVGASRLTTDIAGIANIAAMDYNATAYADFNISDNTSVYIGAGVDYVTAEASVLVFGADASGYGYHATAGIAHRISDNIILEAAVRQLEATVTNDDFGSDVDLDLSATAVTAGVRFRI